MKYQQTSNLKLALSWYNKGYGYYKFIAILQILKGYFNKII